MIYKCGVVNCDSNYLSRKRKLYLITHIRKNEFKIKNEFTIHN